MIYDVIVFWLAVSAVVTASAWLADAGLRNLGVPGRWVWLAALWAPVVLLLVPRAWPELSTAVGGATPLTPMVFELPEIFVGAAGPSWMSWGAIALGVVWATSSALLLFVLARTHVGLALESRRWERTRVSDTEVFISEDTGPAVAGLARPWIVLPRWALNLPSEDLSLIVLHESEHLRGRDTRLLAAALLAVAAAPWNPIAWWQLRRLRAAMEVDCDRRVLRRSPEIERYGKSLIRVAAQNSGVSLGLAAFSERPAHLQQRIVTMTHVRTPWTSFRAAVFALLAVVIGVQGCSLESPVTIDDREARTVESIEIPAGSEAAIAADLRAEPTFTPFTIAPSILNRDEVVRQMVAEYPPLLRDAGVGGTVRVYFFINEDGLVEQVRIDQSSGHPALDEAAMNVAGAYRFSAAMNGPEGDEDPVPVWVSFPITFQVDGERAARPSN